MEISKIILLHLLFLVILGLISFATSDSTDDDFQKCLFLQSPSITSQVYNPRNTSYLTVFNSTARNLRFLSPNFTRPRFIITPVHESHVQAAVVCCRKHGLDLKARSGGHDTEGQSCLSDYPFIIVDFVSYRKISINLEDKSAWIQAGAQVGEVFYSVAETSKSTLGFIAGLAATIGVGGHIGGGGIGSLVRKYGLASDQVIDARIVNVDGKILDRESMGTDLFWALRGGGASNFGVILSWKVRLVPVTPNVTVATIDKTLDQNATSLVYKWQQIADKLDKDLYISTSISTVQGKFKGERTVQASFFISFLGGPDELLKHMKESFPELGLQRKDCISMSWVESTVYFYSRGSPLEVLLDRNIAGKSFLKAKSDYVKETISENDLEAIWKKLLEGQSSSMLWVPLGGKMNEISESETPYPHRAGNLFNILYFTFWLEASDSDQILDQLRSFYAYMGSHVSKSPREAYLNYKDLDLGENKDGVFDYDTAATSWGTKYFGKNFERLAEVKSMVDPENFFKNKQSIPPLSKKKPGMQHI